mmetsp:Transcript_27288/g.24168  ORF Transcript_27288/g.24168 Transcript_27288/m.24168 type:complete len:174 (+) Transcript_27288:890-1411(+)
MTDRLLKVQQAARVAMKNWIEFKRVFDVIEEKKAVVDTELTGLYPDEILQIRTGLEDTANERVTYFLHNKVKSLYKDGPKQSSSKSIGRGGRRLSFGLDDDDYAVKNKANIFPHRVVQTGTNFAKFDLDDSNWQNKTKSSKFLKARQGVGGGHIPGKEFKRQKKIYTEDFDIC